MRKGSIAKDRTIEEEMRKQGLFSSSSAPWQQIVLDDFLSHINFSKDASCLDAACGVGNNIATLLNYFQHIKAFDKSEQAIQFLRQRYSYARQGVLSINVADFHALSSWKQRYDCVICTEALEHVNDYRSIVMQIFQATVNGGYAILSFQNHCNFSAVLKFLFEKTQKKNWDVWGTHDYEGGYENYLTCFQIRREVKNAGFIIEKEVGADYINAWLSWLPHIYRNYDILDNHPLLQLGRVPLVKYFGMDYFVLLKKP